MLTLLQAQPHHVRTPPHSLPLPPIAHCLPTHPSHKYRHETSDYEGRKTIGREQFRLRHYAGDVTYNIEGFVDKNNDLLYRSSKEVNF